MFCLGQCNPRCEYRLGDEPLESSSVEKDLGGPDGQKAEREPAVCACNPGSQMCSELHQKSGGQQGEGGDCPALLGSCEAPCEAPRPGLEPPAQEGRGALGAGPEEGH